MSIKDYKDLNIWKKGIEITDKIYSATKEFPSSELYSLTSQMRRSAVSIPSNIAEGFVRRNMKEYRQFLYVSLGSCAELDTQVIISNKRKYFIGTNSEELRNDIVYEMRMLMTLIKKLG